MARIESHKDHDKAIETLKRGISLNDKSAKLHLGLGHEYRLTEKFDMAADEYKKSSKLGGSEAIDALRCLGDLYYNNLKDPGKAKSFYEDYVKQGGTDSSVKLRLQKM